MITKVGGCKNACRDAVHQIVARLKRERTRKGISENALSNEALKQQGADILHNLLRELKAHKNYALGSKQLGAVGVENFTAQQVMQQAFACSNQQKQMG